MSNWVGVCSISDLNSRNMAKVLVADKNILVVKTDQGVFAIDDTCSHAEVSLSEGSLNGCNIECWAHGAVFDVRSGAVVTPPASEPIATYEVQLQGDGEDAIVSIKIGE